MISIKPEFPALLAAGFHPMELGEIRQLCAARFPLSTTRGAVMDGLEVVVGKLKGEKIEAEVWIDGSFLTEKIDPEDSDIVVAVRSDFVALATQEQSKVLAWINSNLRDAHHCDSYLHTEYPAGHALAGYSEWMRAYWIRQFGFSRGEELKGMALVRVP